MHNTANIASSVIPSIRLSGTLIDFTNHLTDAQKETARCMIQCRNYSPECIYGIYKGTKLLCLETLRAMSYRLPTPPKVFAPNPNTGYTPSEVSH